MKNSLNNNFAISVKKLNAIGDGINDDTKALQFALDTYSSIYLPKGVYKISSTLKVKYNKCLYGAGDETIIKSNNNVFDLIYIGGKESIVKNIKLVNGDVSIKLSDSNNNIFKNIKIESSNIGLVLENNCKINNLSNIEIIKPFIHGVLFTSTKEGFSPSHNKFSNFVIDSKIEDTQGYGIYLQNAFHNIFIDSFLDIYDGANACIRLENADKNSFLNIDTKGGDEDIIIDEQALDNIIVRNTLNKVLVA